MTKSLLACLLLSLAGSAAAAVYGPEAFAKGGLNVKGDVADVPPLRAEGVVRIRYVCRGPVSLAGANLESLDEKGKVIKSQFIWPSVKMPDPSLWDKPRVHLYTLPAHAVAPGARRVRMAYYLHAVKGFGDRPPVFEILGDKVEWRRAPRSEKPGNWFELGEDVVFRGELPAGKTGLRVRVVDAEGAEAFAGDVAGNVWRWRPPEVGFYTVRFAYLDAAGNEEPTIESFGACLHETEKGQPVLRREQEFPRDRQSFAVTAGPARDAAEAPPMFGFNLGPSGLDYPFEQMKRLGMNAFIRYHHFGWNVIEAKGRGRYDWSGVDRAFATALRHGYDLKRILVNPFGTPNWLTTAPEAVRNCPSLRPHLYAPRDTTPWRDFIQAFVSRYPEMEYIELWNEPHLPGYSIFWQKSSPQQFVDLMKAGYEGAKAAKKSITVLMGGQGMRYQPFYEQYVKLGGVRYFDQVDTHCGYNMQHFRETERRLGAESKPYWEGEWHTVLYNCSAKEPPDEETCAYRMLTNMADLIHEGYEKITGFGLTCGEHTPESAPFFARVPGIHQVLGLFRNLPYDEPRLAALALRVATDRFADKIARKGAWAFADDGSERLATFASERGTVGFVWSANDRMKRGGWSKPLAEVLTGRTILDWTGRKVSLADTKPLRVYFVLEPDLALAARRGVKLEHLDWTAYNYVQPRHIAQGKYRALDDPAWNAIDADTRFAANVSQEGLTLDVRAREIKSLHFAVDAVGKGQLQDVVEFEAAADGTVQKTRTPELMGDIPTDFSLAGVPLKGSKVRATAEGWRVDVSCGDLYPWIFAPNRRLPFSLVVRTAKGSHAWGGGLDRFVKATDFGRLSPSGNNRELAGEKGWQTTKAPSIGWAVSRSFVPGSVVRLTGEIRGAGTVFIAAWLSGEKGRSLGRLEGKSPTGKTGIVVTKDWVPFDMSWEMPSDAKKGYFRLFTWQETERLFELRNLRLVNE